MCYKRHKATDKDEFNLSVGTEGTIKRVYECATWVKVQIGGSIGNIRRASITADATIEDLVDQPNVCTKAFEAVEKAR